MYSIGIDVGGTFTDFFCFNQSNQKTFVYKTPSTSDDPSKAVCAGLEALLTKYTIKATDVSTIFHGTTVGTNSILEGKGAKVGLITNSGFRDILHIGRHQRPQHYSIGQEIPWQNRALIERKFRKTVNCRLDSSGNEIAPLDEKSILAHIEFFKENSVNSVLIAFLFSYRNNAHEGRVLELVRDQMPSAFVTTSSSVSPQFREFERFTTGAVAAFIGPKVTHYIDNLTLNLKKICQNAELRIMTSSGGLATPEMIMRHPELTLLSGLVAGANAGLWLASKKKMKNLITLDIGGTSADISIINDGQLNEVSSRNASISGYPVQLPMIDIHTIGAGGGSVARVDAGGGFKVGPESAGAYPGPACYNLGGSKPTVTDANLVLGRLLGDRILDGRMTLDSQMAETSLKEVSLTLGSTINQTALGTISVLNNNMASAIRSRTIQKGIDPRDFSLCAFGGGGPLQAVGVAEILGINEVIIPQNPGIMCAFGLLISRVEYHSVKTLLMTKTQFNLSTLNETLSEMKSDLTLIFERDKAETKLIRFEAFTDLRYVGQGYELKVPLNSNTLGTEHLEQVWDAFHRQHKQEYGHNFLSADIEMVSVKLKAHIISENSSGALSFENSTDETVSRLNLPNTNVEFSIDGKPQSFETEIIDRKTLAGGAQKAGPNVIYQEDSTIVVPPGWTMSVDDDLTLRLKKLDNNNE
ncbi:hydantoinase/oxoprolinase family protein [Paracoccaceae bacterium]|nr:hydantoinase/oxoprolinase family protein [Paracoccaceae bacterium]